MGGICLAYSEDDYEMKNSSYDGSTLGAIEEDVSLDNPAFQADYDDPESNKPDMSMQSNGSDHSCNVSEDATDSTKTTECTRVDIDDLVRKERAVSFSNKAIIAEAGAEAEAEDVDKIEKTITVISRGRSTSVRSIQTQCDVDTRSCRTDSSGFVEGYHSTEDAESIVSTERFGSVNSDQPDKELAKKDQQEQSLSEAVGARPRSVSGQVKKADDSLSNKVTAIIIDEVHYQKKLQAAELKAKAAMNWKDWFKKPLFYKVRISLVLQRTC